MLALYPGAVYIIAADNLSVGNQSERVMSHRDETQKETSLPVFRALKFESVKTSTSANFA